MQQRESIIKNCFQAWITKDRGLFLQSFAEEAVYIESWGPAYRNLAHIEAWFTDWTRDNKVLQWDISKFFHLENTCICTWYFKCECGGNIDGFQGVSIITFNAANQIVLLEEFQSKTPNIYPYE